MTLRTGHGTGKGSPRIEVMPADELPAGLAGPQPESTAGLRPPFAKGSAEAREAGRRGGASKAGTTRLSNELGLARVFSDPGFERYRSAAVNFARLHSRRLAETVGGGECGPAPGSIIQSAALQLAASRWAFEVQGDVALGSKLANDSRQNLLAAHELCAREATIRGKSRSNPLHAAILAAGEDEP